MNTSNICPCCSNRLIRHLGNHREYWLCRHCWSEMPNLGASEIKKGRESAKVINLSTKLPRFGELILAS